MYIQIMVIIIILICLILFYLIFKPYFIKYDNTILFTGGLGAGKTLQAAKLALHLYKRQLLKVKFKNFIIRVKNLFRKQKLDYLDLPYLYSNIPLRINKFHNSKMITKDILTLKTRINEYSVVFLDELSCIADQYSFNCRLVKDEFNEYVQFFRHYVGSYIVATTQNVDLLAKEVRTKFNSEFWCFDFQKFLFKFYRVRVMHNQITENTISLSSDFIEEKTKWTYGILPRRLYNSRTYKNRYKNIKNIDNCVEWSSKDLTTNLIIRLNDYKSELDDHE